MSDTAFIFGAGASKDAGIPLLANFVRIMRQVTSRCRTKNGPLSAEDKEVFRLAMEVMYELDSYHGRAEFDDSNLEDLLSILSFDALGQDNANKDKLERMVWAIARTIELTCEVKHDGKLTSSQSSGDSHYRRFWYPLFRQFAASGEMPTIISLNYDLVLERSLFQRLISDATFPDNFDADGIVLKYNYSLLPDYCYKIRRRPFQTETGIEWASFLETCSLSDLKKPLTIEILKLHGSLNFPVQGPIATSNIAPTNVVDYPLIIPPIANKPIPENATCLWNTALQRLRSTKNLVVVGYSLPRTDVYLQYFLKTALGPNKDFDRLIVFNPTLFGNGSECDEMIGRYESCFSEQIRRRIQYTPRITSGYSGELLPGSFAHLVNELTFSPETILF